MKNLQSISRKKRGLNKKSLSLMLASLLVVGSAIAITVAYLTSNTKTLKNTFSLANLKVQIKESPLAKDLQGNVLDGHTIDKNVTKVDATTTAQTQTYQNLAPGVSYDKDPTVYLDTDVPAYLFIKVNEGELTLYKDDLNSGSIKTSQIIDYSIDSKWQKVTGYNDVYFRKVTDNFSDAKNTGFSILAADGNEKWANNQFYVKDDIADETVSNLQVANSATPVDKRTGDVYPYKTGDISLSFNAYAIQAEGFESATEAWAELSK